jgi:hypothetical protein
MIFISLSIHAQQLGDTSFKPKNTMRTFATSQSPVVLLDEAHHNFHTMDRRYRPFVDILESDGYLVEKQTEKFTKTTLARAAIFGFQFNNGYVEEVTNKAQIFEQDNGNLLAHPILKGTGLKEEITSVKAFTGQAFFISAKR